MNARRLTSAVCACVLLFGSVPRLCGQTASGTYKPPEDIAFRTATVTSDGTRITAELFALTDKGEQRLHRAIRSGRRTASASLLRCQMIAKVAHILKWFEKYRSPHETATKKVRDDR